MTHAAPPPLWPHQRDAVDGAVKFLTDHPRTTLIAACGSGKTRIGAQVTAELMPADRRVLLAAPSVELLAESLREHATCADDPGLMIAVCSEGGSAARLDADPSTRGTEVTTDPALLAALLRTPGPATVACTYQSLDVLRQAHARHSVAPWSLAILDEAHRTAGAWGKPWAAVHDDALIPAERRLYMTATPRLLAERGEERAASMDDEALFGPVCYRLSFAEAIGRGLLADYRVLVPVVTHAEILRVVAARDAAALDAGAGAVDPALLALQVAMLRSAAQYGIRRVITFHNRVAEAEAFARSMHTAERLLPAGERPERLTALHLGSRHGPQQRRTVLDALRSPDPGLVVVANAGVLAEGVDVPAVDAVAFLSPRDSPEAATQAVGRALRTGGRADKTAMVIIPVPLGPEDTPESALEGSAYAPVWRTVRALRAHDERLAQHTDAARYARGRAAYDAAPAPLAMPQWLAIAGVPVPAHFADAIALKLVRESSAPWQERYGEAVAFFERHGHLAPHENAEPTLHAWLYRQRRMRRDGQLTEERIALLDRVGMAWNPFEEAWARGIAAARAYHALHGHLRVPSELSWGAEPGFPLGKWLTSARREHRKGTLAAERFAQLDALGFAWSTLPKSEQDWNRKYEAARAHHAAHGNLRGPVFKKWLIAQRRARRRGELAAWKIAALDALGVSWEPLEDNLARGLEAARAFHTTHGHLRVPGDAVAGDPHFGLREWIARQRMARTQGALDAERIQALDALGMVWAVFDESWEAYLAATAGYGARHGVAPVRGSTYGQPPLNIYDWLVRQRGKHRDGTLDPKRAARLLQLLGPGWADGTWPAASAPVQGTREPTSGGTRQ
jgi:superfamily II DNA or RNA helicase